MAGRYDFVIEQGVPFTRTMTWRDDANTVVNLTGYTAKLQIRSRAESTTPILELSTSNGRITLGGATGIITLTLDATTTGALNFVRGVYQLELYNGSSVPTRLLEGVVSLSKEVVR